MQQSAMQRCLLIAASCLVATDASPVSHHVGRPAKEHYVGGHTAQPSSEQQTGKNGFIQFSVGIPGKSYADLGSMVEAHLQGKGPGVAEVMKTAQDKMELGDAMQRLHGKLPTEVTALVGTQAKAATAGQVGPFDEASLKKANAILNNMIEKAWETLDNEIIKCKEFEARNRGTYDQVMTDLARLGEQIADLERMQAEAIEGMNSKDFEFSQLQSELRKQQVIYMKMKWANQQEMTIRQNDLQVMTFVLELTKCKDGSSTAIVAGAGLAQVGKKQPQSDVRVCSGGDGQDNLMLHFDDPQLEARLEQKMTPGARRALREALGQVVASSKLSLLEEAATTITTTTTMGLPTPPMRKVAVRERPSSEGFWKICKKDEDVNCGLLHDTMSLEWGKFKDSVDELQHEMDKNEADFFELRSDLNAQMEIVKIAKARFMMMLAEAISNKNADQSEQTKKTQQRHELDTQFFKFMAECRRVISEIMFTNICAVMKVRNEVMSHSVTIDITDCDVTNWVPGDCTVMCDDSCPTIFKANDDPYMCGGWQRLEREVIIKPNERGVKCPATRRNIKCNQQKCPVDCEQSMWSAYSKCTKDCEGGVQGRTRSILMKPANGGESCNTASEERACNTGSCDRDCTLTGWSSWGYCSMACGGGLQERSKRVVIPTRGEGVCPKDHSAERWNERACNTQECVGDEICIAKQDLVISIDGSGSLRETGFVILRNFAAGLIDRYKSKYFGANAMMIGVVLFGNGEVMSDGTVSPAVEVHKLSSDLATVKSKISALTWQKGFTNMAQACALAEKMFLREGRKSASQSAVMILTDGKPTLLYETNEKLQELKDKAVKIFMAPVTQAKGAEIKLMKEWASQPWQSHMVHVPGLMPLSADPEVFAQKFIATFCPKSMSPSANNNEECGLGFFLLKEKSICGDPTVGTLLSSTCQNVGECSALTREAKMEAFSYGEWYRRGYCVSEVFTADAAQIAQWKKDRANPDATAACKEEGGWVYNGFYDTYVNTQEC